MADYEYPMDNSIASISTDDFSEFVTIKDTTMISNRIDVRIDMLENILNKLKFGPLYKHECINCGGTVEWDINKGIFICPYCGTHYALNTARINSNL